MEDANSIVKLATSKPSAQQTSVDRKQFVGEPANMVWRLCLIKIDYTFCLTEKITGPALAKNTHIVEDHCQRSRGQKVDKLANNTPTN